ncbi:MAG: glycosyltransferase, partial [Pseudonocardia sp.]|nr:glycosyltransferase [Pseudonocardia sp.]
MRVLVAIHQLDLGGSQTNAVDLASGVRDRGNEVVVAGPDGPLVDVVRERGLRYERVELDRLGRAGPGYRRLLAVSRDVAPDLLHTYELTPSLLGFYGPHLLDRTPMTMTINSMAVPEFMPATVPLQVCNPVIAAGLRRRGAATGGVELPPAGVGQEPGFPGEGFRAEIGAGPDELLVVAVSRFARVLKQQGLETAIRAAARLAPRHPMRLVLVGDGPAMPDLRALADRTNRAVGREAVVLTGERRDPRSAYAAADVVLGMGGSLLRDARDLLLRNEDV